MLKLKKSGRVGTIVSTHPDFFMHTIEFEILRNT